MSALSFVFSSTDSDFCSDRVVMNFFSAATSATDMDIDKALGDEEADDAATSKAGTLFPT